MNISDVAKITGLTSKAIRFYEEKGLVTPPMRSENGYRTYTQQHLNELTLLRQARQVGFNLEESGELVNLFNDPQRHSADVKRRTLEKVAEIERHIEELQSMRNQLLALANACPGDDSADCPIIENLSGCCHHRAGLLTLAKIVVHYFRQLRTFAVIIDGKIQKKSICLRRSVLRHQPEGEGAITDVCRIADNESGKVNKKRRVCEKQRLQNYISLFILPQTLLDHALNTSFAQIPGLNNLPGLIQ